ncbi:MAG: CDP-alcohol phosphatidyltransferase [Cytophagaceae bacterium]|jgi:phosphatidylglycerophosphate synthase|nr:CDP-alcohol phosphatidyltransferase [Cytophagaceae bacterium]
MDQSSESRRPIATRDAGWARRTAAYLAKQGVTPNTISVLSIFFSLLSFLAFYGDLYYHTFHWLWMILAIAFIQLRLIMNLFDGMVAVEHHQKSVIGGLFNEVPDRISDTFTLFGVGLLVRDMPYGMDLAYLAIILAVTTAYIRTLGASLGSPHYFIGPMAKQHRMAFVCAGCIVAIFYVPVFYYVLIVMNIGQLVTCWRRLAKIVAHLKQHNS